MARYMVIYSGEYVGETEAGPANLYPPENSVLAEEEDGRWRRVTGEELREVYRLLTGDYPLLPVANILFPIPAHKKTRRD